MRTLTEAEAVRNAALQYELTREAQENYAKAVDFERGKYRSGHSSLNLVIDLEDRYVRARLSVIEAIRRYSVSLARLKFAGVAALGTGIFVTYLVPTSLLFLPLAQVITWLGLRK